MPNLKRWAAAALSVAMLASAAAGCSTGSTEGGDKTLRIGLDSDILKIDPAYAYDFTTNPVINQVTQALMYYDQNDQLTPLLAKEWNIVDETTYVYAIRDDVKFSNGNPMTMDDVVYSLNRHFDPAVGSLLTGQFSSVASIEATGPWELTVKLKQADSTFINVLAGTPGHIVEKAYCLEKGSDVGNSANGIIGTGPYKYVLGSWVNGSGLKLEANENYWKTDDMPYYTTLDIKTIAEETTRVAALQNGDVDVLTLPPAALLDSLYSDSNITVLDKPSYGLVYMAFNHQKKPFDDPRIHKAIAHGINFAQIHETLVKRAGSAPTSIPISSALFASEPERWNAYLAQAPVYEYSPEKAKALLAEAGYADGLSLSLMTNEDGMRNAICVAMQEQLAQIGVTVNINKVSGDEHTAYQFGDKLGDDGLRGYDILMAGWSGDFPDVSQILEPLYETGQTANAAAYSNPALDALIAQQLMETEPAKRNDALFKAMDIVTQDMPYLVALYPQKTYALTNKITGIDEKVNWVTNVHFQDARPAQ
jgi:peptide/nickel transport system substrate-binding protein